MRKSYAIAEVKNLIEKTDLGITHITDIEKYNTAMAKDMFDDLETIFKLYLNVPEKPEDFVNVPNEEYHKLLNPTEKENGAEVKRLKDKVTEVNRQRCSADQNGKAWEEKYNNKCAAYSSLYEENKKLVGRYYRAVDFIINNTISRDPYDD